MPIVEKPAPTAHPIDPLLGTRWSPRAYAADRPLTRDQIDSLCEAARWAPSCFGDQPWRWIVCDRAVQGDSWQNAFDTLAEGNQGWVKDAPVMFVLCADSEFTANGEHNRWGQYDSGAAAMSLVLQAVSLGLAAHQMGGFDSERLRTAFDVPARFTPMAVISVGYQAEISTLDEATLTREQAPRERAETASRFGFGTWPG